MGWIRCVREEPIRRRPRADHRLHPPGDRRDAIHIRCSYPRPPAKRATRLTLAPPNDPLAEPFQAEVSLYQTSSYRSVREPAIHRTPPWGDTLAGRRRRGATLRTGSERSGLVPDAWATVSVWTKAQRSPRARPA